MRWLVLFLAVAVSGWADPLIPTLTFAIPDGKVWIQPAPPYDVAGYIAIVPYPENPVTTLTSSNTPAHSGVTRNLSGGGGLLAHSGALTGGDATHWYFGVPQVQYMLIEDGMDLDNDAAFTGPLDILPFSLLTFSVGTSTITRSGSEFVLTMNIQGLSICCADAVGALETGRLDEYFGMSPSTEWVGLLTLTFVDQTSGRNFDTGWGGPAHGQLVYTATPEPSSIIFLATLAIGVGFAKKRWS